MGEVEDLQVDGCGDVRGDGADLVVAEVELADALRRTEVGNLLDPALRPSLGFLPHEVIEHCHYLKNNAHVIGQGFHYLINHALRSR